MLTVTAHHVGARRPCADCGTQVFEYADEVDAAGTPLRHFCRMCADRRRGVKLCGLCRRPVEYSADIDRWFHATETVFDVKHPATPEEG